MNKVYTWKLAGSVNEKKIKKPGLTSQNFDVIFILKTKFKPFNSGACKSCCNDPSENSVLRHMLFLDWLFSWRNCIFDSDNNWISLLIQKLCFWLISLVNSFMMLHLLVGRVVEKLLMDCSFSNTLFLPKNTCFVWDFFLLFVKPRCIQFLNHYVR